MQSKRFRKFRKSRKSRKTKGGSPPSSQIINVMIPFTMSNVPKSNFRPSVAFGMPNSLKEIFTLAVFDHIHADDPVDDLFSQNEDILEPENAFVQIHRIRGAEDSIVFDGNIHDWTPAQIQEFLSNLLAGDVINIEPITNIE